MNRRGVALFSALVALLLAGALATLVLAAARLRWLTGYRQLAARQALEAARGAVAWHTAEWDSALAGLLVPGTVAGLPGPDPLGSLRTHDSVVRLGSHLYLVRSVGEALAADGSVLARDGIAQLVELRAAGPEGVGGLARSPGAQDLTTHLGQGLADGRPGHHPDEVASQGPRVTGVSGDCRYGIETVVLVRTLLAAESPDCSPGPMLVAQAGARAGRLLARRPPQPGSGVGVRPVGRGWWRWQ